MHHYFYIRDPVSARTFPFQTTYYLDRHNIIEIELRRQGVTFREDDNASLSTSDRKHYRKAPTSSAPPSSRNA